MLDLLVLKNTYNFAMQDLKPRFHSSRFHGSEDAEDDVRFYKILIFTCFASVLGLTNMTLSCIYFHSC